jgi:hypothetical protein
MLSRKQLDHLRTMLEQNAAIEHTPESSHTLGSTMIIAPPFYGGASKTTALALERKGLIERTIDEPRRIRWELTDAGREAVEALAEA